MPFESIFCGHSPPPITEPDPSALTCPGDRVGLCAGSQRKTHKYSNAGGIPDRVTPPSQRNLRAPRHVVPNIRPINDAHVAVPGLAVVEVAAADDDTAFAVQELLAARCAIAPTDRTIREPDEPGVRLRFFLDLRQEADA